MDHRQARAELAKLAPEVLQGITARLPAGLLMELHRWAEENALDLATAIRELTTLGLETATRPSPASAVDRKEVKKWQKAVERALRGGKSPFEPFLVQDNPNLEALRSILAKLDYQSIYQGVKEKREKEEPWVERTWKQMKAEAPSHLQPLMAALDNLERRFLARKKLYHMEGPDGPLPIIHWLLSDDVMQILDQPASEDVDFEAVRQLVAARYLVAEGSNRPWEFAWDE